MAVASLFGLVAAACQPSAPAPRVTAVAPSAPETATATLTPDGTDRYRYGVDPTGVTVRAPRSNTGGNTRDVVWHRGSRPTRDQQSCAVWRSEDGDMVQHGAALRIHQERSGRTRAITVTRSIFFGAKWLFNVHTWDTARPDDESLQPLGRFDLSGGLIRDGELAPLPYRVCARVVADRFELKAWPLTDPEPSWDDPGHTGAITLPPEWVYEGRAGWYVGHLKPGDSTRFEQLEAADLPAD